MRLNSADRRFIAIVAGPYAGEVAAVMTEWPERLRAMCKIGAASRPQLWRQLIKLTLQCLLASSRPSACPRGAITFWERDKNVNEKRATFLRRFVADIEPCAVGGGRRLVRARPQWHQFGTLLRLALLLLHPEIGTSLFAEAYLRVVRDCFIAGSNSTAAGSPETYVFRPYRPETPFICAWLRRHGITVHLVTLTTPLVPYCRAVCADDVKLLNPYHRDEVALLRRQHRWPTTELWAPQEFPELESLYAHPQRPHHPNELAFYSQGFRQRVREGIDTEDDGTPAAEHEEHLHEQLRRYLEAHDDVSLRIYPHPLERRRMRATGEHDLGRLLEHPRVSINWEGESSARDFMSTGLGIAAFSTIGFDRVFFGFPTLFYARPGQFDKAVDSPYRAIFVASEEEFGGALDEFRRLTADEFSARLFGAQGAPWRAWARGDQGETAAPADA